MKYIQKTITISSVMAIILASIGTSAQTPEVGTQQGRFVQESQGIIQVKARGQCQGKRQGRGMGQGRGRGQGKGKRQCQRRG